MRNVRLILTGFIALCFLCGSFSSAWTAERKKALKTKKAMKTIQTNKTKKKAKRPVKKPDLIVRDIKLISKCKIKVTLKNIGAAGVPNWVYANNKVDVQMYKGGAPWGGMVLRVFDPSGILKTPGGTVSKIWFPGAANLNIGPGVHSIRVHVDSNTELTESNEGNNTLTKRLRCKEQGPAPDQRKPDLTVKSIRLIGDCKMRVTIRNEGPGKIPDWVYDPNNMTNIVTIQMLRNGQGWGGVALREMDPTRLLKQPGGMISWMWFPNAPNLNLTPGWQTIKVQADANSDLSEADENNNELTRRLNCK